MKLTYNVPVRIALYIVLLANLALFAWARLINVPMPAARDGGSSSLPRLTLAEEAGPSAPRDDPAAAEPPRGLVTAQCVSVGPFDDPGSAARGADLLRKRGFPSRLRLEAGTGPEAYWVYVPGIPSDAAAAMDLRKLAERGLKDASVLQPSRDERRILVGMFTVLAQANIRQLQVRRLGLKADIAERRLPALLFWVDVAVRSEHAPLPAEQSLKIGARPCPEGAPMPGAPAPQVEPLAPRTTAMAEATAELR